MGWFIFAIVLVIVLVVGIWFLHRFYAKANREIALVRTGLGGQRVVMDGGCLALPILHHVQKVSMRAMAFRIVRDGVLDTVLGPIPAAPVENGRKALCLVRADGIEITTAPPNGGPWYVRMRVETARVLGPTSYLLLTPVSGKASGPPPATIEARLPGIRVSATGNEIWARAREEQTFVFAL